MFKYIDKISLWFYKIIVLGLLILSFGHFAFAGTISDWSDGFDIYSTGDINGQGLWVGTDSNQDIVSSPSRSGFSARKYSNTSGIMSKNTGFDISTLSGTYSLSVYLRQDNETNTQYISPSDQSSVNSSHIVCWGGINTSGDFIVDSNSSAGVVVDGSWSLNTWHKFELILDFDNNLCFGRVDGGALSSSVAFTSTALSNLTYLLLNGSSFSGNSLYYEDIVFQSFTDVSGGFSNSVFTSTDPSPEINGDIFGTTTSGSKTVSGVTVGMPRIHVGMQVQGVGIPDDTFVKSVSSSSFVLGNSSGTDVNATVTGDTALAFLDVKAPTSDPFVVHYYVSSSDFVSGMQVCMYFYNDGVTAFPAFEDTWATQMHDRCDEIASSGAGSFSTTDINMTGFTGLSSVHFVITKPTWYSSIPILGNLFNDGLYSQLNVRFVINKLSGFDLSQQNGTLGGYLRTGDPYAPNGSTLLSSCNVLSGFNAFTCLQNLIIPPSQDISIGFKAIQNGILKVWPLGYITRIVSILSDPYPIQPPPMTYTFGTSSPSDLQGETISFQPWDNLDEVTDITSDQVGSHTIWDIVDPFFNTLVAFLVFFIILSDILNTDYTGSIPYVKKTGGFVGSSFSRGRSALDNGINRINSKYEDS